MSAPNSLKSRITALLLVEALTILTVGEARFASSVVTAASTNIGPLPAGIETVHVTAGNAQRVPDQSAGLRIIVIAGEDSVNIIQQKTAVAPIVEVRDRNDLPVAGAIVTFAVASGQATFGSGLQQVSLTTNAAGRAAVAQINPVTGGAYQMNVTAVYQGETATATISQTNFASALDATQAGRTPSAQGGAQSGASGTAGGSAGTSGAAGAGAAGGLSTAAIATIAAGIAGGVATAVAVGSKSESSATGASGSTGTTGTSSSNPTTNRPPTVSSANASPALGLQASTTISFSVQGSDPDGDSLTYAWDFGDGATSNQPAPSHLYNTTGTFTVRIVVSDGRSTTSGQTTVIIRGISGAWQARNTLDFAGIRIVMDHVLNLTQSSGSVTGSGQALYVSPPGIPSSGVTLSGAVRAQSPFVTLDLRYTGGVIQGLSATWSCNSSADLNTLNCVETSNSIGTSGAPVTLSRQ